MDTLWQTFCLLAQQNGPAAPGGGGGGGIQTFSPLLPLVMIGVLFYLMMVKPERRKRAELEEMLKNLKKNDRVVTASGILGTVVQASQDADEVTLRVDENTGTRIRVLRSAILRVVSAEGATESKES
jgi:preprotein translocase subunit YajC